jgi:hypothetical protein
MNSDPKNTLDAPTRDALIGCGAFIVIMLLLFHGCHKLMSPGSNVTSPPENSAVQEKKIPDSSKKVEEAKEEPVFRTTAAELLAIYNYNAVAADNALKDRIIVVSGTVDKIDRDILNNPYITLDTGELLASVQCFFDESQVPRLVELQPGQKVRIRGRCAGKAIFNVILEDCSFEPKRGGKKK